MYNLLMIVITLSGVILRSVFPRVLYLAWATPDFLLLLVVFNAMFRGYAHGGAAGFLIGLTEDLFYGRFIGLNALAKCVVGILAGLMSKSIFKENLWVPVINVFFGSIVCMLLVFIFGHLAGARWHFTNIAYQGLFEVLFNVCLVPFAYGPFFQFANKRLRLDDDN
jgi:rod shape-determining protein MreD